MMMSLKGMPSHVVLLIVSCILLIISIVLHIICLAMPHYAEAEDLGRSLSNRDDLLSYKAFYPNMDTSYGFWQVCMKIYGNANCYNFRMEDNAQDSSVKSPDWLIACQAMSLIGLILGCLGMVFTLIWFCASSVCLLVFGSISTITGGAAIIIANIVFATQMSIKFIFQADQVNRMFGSPKEKYLEAADSAFSYGWGFGLDIATGITCILLGAVFAICASMCKSGRFYITKSVV